MERLRALARGAAAHIVKAALTLDLRDVFVFGGLACAVHGVSLLSVPAAWIVGGTVLFLLGARR